jgi:hypothetical protein
MLATAGPPTTTVLELTIMKKCIRKKAAYNTSKQSNESVLSMSGHQRKEISNV